MKTFLDRVMQDIKWTEPWKYQRIQENKKLNNNPTISCSVCLGGGETFEMITECKKLWNIRTSNVVSFIRTIGNDLFISNNEIVLKKWVREIESGQEKYPS